MIDKQNHPFEKIILDNGDFEVENLENHRDYWDQTNNIRGL